MTALAMRRELAKWSQTMQVAWSNQLAYKLNFVLLVIGPTVVFFFIKYNLWTSIFGMEGVTKVGGYDLSSMLRYQVWVMVVAFLAQGYNSMNLAEDIRMGRISSYLIYPFGFWQFHTATFLAFQAIQALVAGVTVLALFLLGLLSGVDWLTFAQGVGFSFVVGFFWFSVCFVLGLVAFWLEETWVLRVMFLIVSNFLSGAIIPLELYPDWLTKALAYTPFPYMTFVPAKVFMGAYEGSILTATGILILWTLVVGFLAALIWRRGLRLYTAAGM